MSGPDPTSAVTDEVVQESWLGALTRKLIANTIAGLPTASGSPITLRGVEGWDSAEACSVLELNETDQRVLLHRLRQTHDEPTGGGADLRRTSC